MWIRNEARKRGGRNKKGKKNGHIFILFFFILFFFSFSFYSPLACRRGPNHAV
jgi:hypothetical protein